ncbi:SCP2 sterol-binding domain-containing protein [Infirmifilum sp. NZ]|uniref:SCP2 sterol-binding domain-containing protein n=1 Tax=Infirmifilum sp. NZ TaxID=2926850 RepID=UPI0027A40AE8|nr:alkyl sulfatase C-terminal domain-containing protein [Infirmifilum sp. NZ]UNQ73473.1 SCP2 sterol-binding domain-containing protein [Infirmifilum sp. NZ]
MGEDLERSIELLKKRFEDPEVVKSLSGFTKVVIFEFPDVGKSYTFNIENGLLKSVIEGAQGQGDIRITMSSTTFTDIMSKKANPIREYQLGRITVKGSMSDLLKMRKLLL